MKTPIPSDPGKTQSFNFEEVVIDKANQLMATYPDLLTFVDAKNAALADLRANGAVPAVRL